MHRSFPYTLKSPGGTMRTIKTFFNVSKAFDTSAPGPRPQLSPFEGLWDTGASGTVISQTVVTQLGLQPIGKSKVYHGNGDSIVDVFLINLFLPQDKITFPFLRVTKGILTGFDLLIGMDVITAGDFSITNLNRRTVFSFRIPSSHEVDFEAEHAKLTAPITQVVHAADPNFPKQGRNSICSCGSGKKYKQCHGK